ncbi:molybdate ABC transporter, permease protein [Desulfocapsa sulfexigens DSM 10523]|uniref:Molybdenum transport system permease n=1 Tax=Desulfocapsa sulfexigens (strain DSM 10523 / SB164P1) TaxID=1167006 RepID=M1NBC0_DESSD|nr:molybdate ABC transporter permease subunit [Desulfocapsa sulfexigens]AGF77099.1 molybdate ABC transporter, permease protein [Desulfocapsa sulfexigens DSM 10523]
MSLTPQDIQAIILSLKVATAATLLSLPLGFAAAYLLVFTRIPGRAALEGVVNLPLVLPPVVVGYLLLLLFGQSGSLGPVLRFFDLRIIFTLKGAVIASAVVGFPLLVRSIRIGMEGIDEQYLQAARTLGARWWDSLYSVILPLSGRAVLAGMTLMFARSLGEFGATIILAGNIPGVTQTIPLAIYEYTNTPGGDSMALSLCLVSIGLSFLVLLVSEASARSFRRR